jgi:type IV pilus assembly protein PilY1
MMKYIKKQVNMTPFFRKTIVSKFKVAGISTVLTALLCAALPMSYASDIEIYKVPEDSVGSTTLMLMLDLSGSMGYGAGYSNTSMSIQDDYGVCVGSRSSVVEDTTTTPLYSRYYCPVSASAASSKVKDPQTGCEKQANGNYRCYDRLTRLKDGLREILQGTPTVPRVSDKIVLGLSTFAGDNGYIRVPARPLSEVIRSYQVAETYIDQEEYEERVQTGTTQEKYYYDLPRWTRYSETRLENQTCIFGFCWGGSNVKRTYYQTCTWTNNTCSWGTRTETRPSGFSDTLPTTTCTAGNNNDCVIFYERNKEGTREVPVYETVIKTRPVEKVRYVTKNVTQRDLLLETIKDLKASGGTPTPYAYSEAAAYLMGQATSDSTYSGFSLSVGDAKDTSKTRTYLAPQSISGQVNNPEKRECSGQGIYFLTDGEPQHGGTAMGWDGKSGTAYTLMSTSLGNKGTQFDCSVSPLGNRSGYMDSRNGWACVGKYAQALLDPAKNPVGLKIKTAVVGFGSDFSGDSNPDVQDAKDWGILGGGGWKAGSNSKDISDSINKFVEELNKDIPSMSTGSSTIPLDDLNPAIVQPYSYFPQFEPKVNPVDRQQIWFGNLKKFHVVNNGVYASKTPSDLTVVVKKSKLQDLADIWAKAGISYPENAPIFKKGGALSQLPLGLGTNTAGNTVTARTLLTDYSYDGTKPVAEQVSRNLDLVKIDYTYTTNAKTKTDGTYSRALMSLLGFNIPSDISTNDLDLSTYTATVRQMGSVLHSRPILITQQGKAVAVKDPNTGKVSIGSENREDYVLFGTTQGLVHVVNAESGIEKFSFVPKEIIENQSETFKNEGGNLAGGKDALYYGIDGEWTAHTEYVSKSDGTLTVKGSSRTDLDGNTENLSGKQWVYGGMRMGGRSYYALDLTDINSPKIKFHIDPSTGKVYSQKNPAGKSFSALSKMGQSWSKPSLGYINWQGKRKFVMIVGGGYDAGGADGDGLKIQGIRTGYAGYETYNYVQNNKIGAGVYIFDADTGDLLWNADSGTNEHLKYSIVSQIRTVDRNNDGVIDHLYFGDLAGQAFRVDFKNDGATTFTAQANRILNLNQNNGTSPRFYTMPAFTAHYSAGSNAIYGGNIVVATFVSGNQSSPLVGTVDSAQKKDPLSLQYDAAYAIYDYDVYPSTAEGRYPTSNMEARTLASSSATSPVPTQLRYVNNATSSTTVNRNSGWGGWYYVFNKKFDNSEAAANIIKGLTTPIALEGSLYVTQYDASNNGTTSSCGAGVKGHSFTQRLCLPTGVCKQDANYTYNLGSGIVNLNVGSTDSDPNKRSLVVPDPNDVCSGPNCSPCKGTACGTNEKFLETGGSLRFIPNRWYEKYAQ